MSKLNIYSRGLVYMSICTDLSEKELEMYLGEHEPTGTDLPWEIADEDFASGEPNGHQCPDVKGNKHWLVSC